MLFSFEIAFAEANPICRALFVKLMQPYQPVLNQWIPIDGTNHRLRTEFFRRLQQARLQVYLKLELDSSTEAIVKGTLSQVRPYTLDYPQLNFAVDGTMQRFRSQKKMGELKQFGLLRFSTVRAVYISSEQFADRQKIMTEAGFHRIWKRSLLGVYEVQSGKEFFWSSLHEKGLADFDDLLDVANYLAGHSELVEIRLQSGERLRAKLDPDSSIKSLALQLLSPVFLNGQLKQSYGTRSVDISDVDTIRRVP